MFDATWGRGRDVSDPAELAAILSEAGVDGEASLEKARSPQAKTELRAATDAAIGLGVFGVPTTVVGSELFWGSDQLDFILAFIAGRDAGENASLDALIARPPDLERPR